MTGITDEDADRIAKRGKPRPKGTLPYLPDEQEAEPLRDWLTFAFRPKPGWRAHTFERAGRQKTDPCSITFRNGRDAKVYRFNAQGDLWNKLRTVVIAAADGDLRMPHLTAGETEDVWAALCALGTVLTEHDERDEVRIWLESLLDVSTPLTGYTLVPDGRHDALMAIRAQGRFGRRDALALTRSVNGEWTRRPVRVIDQQTQEQWIRASEAASYVRFVLGVEPLSYATLRARLNEIGVAGKYFEDYRPPHPKLTLYRLSETLVTYAEESK